jgi:hypothetical protein
MKRIILSAIVATLLAGPVAAQSISIPSISGYVHPPSIGRIDGAKVDAFWSCVAKADCNPFTLNLTTVSEDRDNFSE